MVSWNTVHMPSNVENILPLIHWDASESIGWEIDRVVPRLWISQYPEFSELNLYGGLAPSRSYVTHFLLNLSKEDDQTECSPTNHFPASQSLLLFS